MADYGLPALYALFVWWFSTGAIIWLDGLPPRTYRRSMLGATAMLAAAFWGLAASSADASPLGAYAAFSCGLLAWAWQEMAFLMGFATGPRRQPCPDGCTGWPRFRLAVQTILYHELAILAGAIAVLVLTWGQPNQIGAWTFLLLWGMRQSAKLNVFLGVRNLNEQFLPPHLAYLGSFFARKPMNLLFPLSVTGGTLLCAWFFHRALAGGASDFEAAGSTFLGVLTALAILEHWFLVLPIPAEALWSWSMKSRRPAAPAVAEAVPPRLHALRPAA
ncbi:putative photosynthetic complex assembly protein PuhE [Belnapia rosea]|uniref:putative photosynthetic complex assembly protein PuhE n=1 Tax=Belnapia rosea TaxID=938405 RepID=UPI000883B5C7|nr:putative photosynthetic complex assembly protein PuhE [Belnapia rosea]SDB70986.1 putative photosynthetic complex assembly protein 2 [Belnapia rosea]